MSEIRLTVNGVSHTVDVDPTTPLLYVLSDDLGLRGPKFGCGLGQCGACTAIVGGKAVRSCVTPVSTINGSEVRTLEGLGDVDHLHPIQKAFIDEQAAQCGFCLNGVILTAKALLDERPNPTDAEIEQAMSTVLCRCFTHTRMLRAIKRYARLRPAERGGRADGRRSAAPEVSA
jgi:nicotinate dehydrogenase subunit A